MKRRNLDEVRKMQRLAGIKRLDEGTLHSPSIALDDLKSHLATSSVIDTTAKTDFLNRIEMIEEFLDQDEPDYDDVRLEVEELEEDVLAMFQSSEADTEVYSELFQELKSGLPEEEDDVDYLSGPEYDYLDDEQMDQLGLEEYEGGGKNPEGDKLVLRFLQGIAKKFNYPVSHAAQFVKERLKNLGY